MDTRTRELAAAAAPPPAELAQLAQSMGTARNLLDVFRALRVFIEAVVGNNALYVSLLESDRQMRRCVFAWTDGVEVDVTELPAMPVTGSSAPHARAVSTGEVVIVTDLQSALVDSPNVALGYERDSRAPNISIAVPLIHLGRVIGGFEVQIIDHCDPASCVPSLQVAANLAAAAIENVRLITTERELRHAAEASEERYRSSEHRLRLALEAAGLATWETEGIGGEFTWSPATDRVLVWPSAAPPRTWRELIDLVKPEDRAHLTDALAGITRAYDTREVEFRIGDASGQIRWLACRIHSMPGSRAGVPRVLAVVLDITGRKEAEHQRQALARSEQLRALGQMASGIAHDLNQSLALISGYGELAVDALKTRSAETDDAINMVDMAVRAAQDGARTLQRLLAFARASEAEVVESVDLAQLLPEVAQLTAPRWRAAAQEAQGIELDVEVPPDTALLVKSSQAMLREAFTNLIFNAVDALSEGGTIRLRGAAVGDRVVAEVSDNGPGIPRELQARIFEPFFTTKGDRGTGLGLAQVSSAVARLGGELTVESEQGCGTTFRMLLPRAEADVTVRRVERQRPRLRTSRRRVLAVDDEPKLRNMIARMLQSEGHQVTLAGSGEAALEILQQQEGAFDLVLTDISMGAGMSGWDLASHVQARWRSIPIVLATGWGVEIDAAQARTRGIAGVLAKPFRVSDLRETVANLTADA